MRVRMIRVAVWLTWHVPRASEWKASFHNIWSCNRVTLSAELTLQWCFLIANCTMCALPSLLHLLYARLSWNIAEVLVNIVRFLSENCIINSTCLMTVVFVIVDEHISYQYQNKSWSKGQYTAYFWLSKRTLGVH